MTLALSACGSSALCLGVESSQSRTRSDYFRLRLRTMKLRELQSNKDDLVLLTSRISPGLRNLFNAKSNPKKNAQILTLETHTHYN